MFFLALDLFKVSLHFKIAALHCGLQRVWVNVKSNGIAGNVVTFQERAHVTDNHSNSNTNLDI